MKRNAGYRAAMSGQDAYARAGVMRILFVVPDAYRFVTAAGRQAVALRGENDLGNRSGMSAQGQHIPARVEVP